MTNPLFIRNARFLDPGQNIDRVGNMVIREGRIVWWGSKDRIPGAGPFDLIEGEGRVVCPGFIDLHCHLREPGFEEKETIATGAAATLRGGFTTICCMPNTNPPLDSPELIELVKTRAASTGVRVLPIGCVTKGRAGKELVDMESLARAGAAGFSDDGDSVRDDGIMRQALVMSKKLGLPVIDHCEDPVGGPSGGEVRMIARDLRLAEETGGWIHIAHVSVAESADIIGKAKSRGVHVTAEVTPHHLTLTSKAVQAYGTLAKVNPPLRSEHDRQAMVRALKEGVIDCIATDHAPHTPADKAKPYAQAASGISGFETAFGSLMSLVHAGELTLEDIVLRLTATPAKLLGERAARQGALVVGAVVDITILDLEKQWVVNSSNFASKGRNTPLGGQILKGKIVATLPQGHIAYADESLKIVSGFVPAGQEA